MGKKQRVILPPQLPPEITEDEVEVSDEDLQFVKENREYAGFLKSLDTQSITKHVTRVANQKEDVLEELYEKRIRKKSSEKDKAEDGLEVDPVDALPVKTLDGKLYYRTASGASQKAENAAKGNENSAKNEDDGVQGSVVKLTKPERRAKLKKSRKEAKKQAREQEEVQPNHQAEVLVVFLLITYLLFVLFLLGNVV